MTPDLLSATGVRIVEPPATLKDLFKSRGRPVLYTAGQQILASGSLDTDVFWIQKGSVMFSLMSAHGKEVILRNLTNGDIFGESAPITKTPRSVDATAINECLILRLNGSEFIGLLNATPEVGVWLTHVLAQRVVDLSSKVFEMATLPVAGRLQLKLIRLGETSALGHDRKLIKSLPTHLELASIIGTQREAVTRELRLLEKAGIVAKKGKDLEVVSMTKLRASYSRFVT
jgi:CRP/FNR family transcriptional regulator, cyclic AMP receptor protein